MKSDGKVGQPRPYTHSQARQAVDKHNDGSGSAYYATVGMHKTNGTERYVIHLTDSSRFLPAVTVSAPSKSLVESL